MAVATSKMERFVIIVNGWKPLTTKHSILDVAAALDPPLVTAGLRLPAYDIFLLKSDDCSLFF